VSLNGVKARITTTNGTQLVTFTVPDGALPSFYPDLYKTFYYEELPIRLIYRVGLSDDELNTLKNTKSEINKTYYTNKHNGADNEGLAYATFTPDSSNPYYNTAFTKSTKKNNNTTQTSNYALVEKSTASGNTFTVKQSLGNNGSLSFSRDEIEETEFVFPETGGKGTTLYSIFGVSLILCSVSVYIINKRRKEANSLDV
jgi:LPXTG-motif cell wall-anchored protein